MANRTLIQFFHWYSPDDASLWKSAAENAPYLAELGITDVWLPPVSKGASGGYSVGYDAYDLFDLGEFDQKGSVRTKYGTRDELEQAVAALSERGIGTIFDAVFNHKMGADERERVTVRRVNPDDRGQIDADGFEAWAWTKFTFPGRAGAYSEFVWDRQCFGGTDHIEEPDEDGLFKIENEYDLGSWSEEVDSEKGNFDYVMGTDIEFRNPAVREEVKYWGRWMGDQFPVAGFRLDAAKHIPAWFIREWVGHVRETVNSQALVIAEYWNPDFGVLADYLNKVDHQLQLFDVALHHRFHDASCAGADFDLRTIFDGSLVAQMPDHAVTIVANHDTQPLQAMAAPVEAWFKPLAYGLILLREQGLPCVFHADLYGAQYTDIGDDGNDHEVILPALDCLPGLIVARQRFAHGPQTDLIDDDPSCTGFVRHGTAYAQGCVVVVTNGPESGRNADLGPDHGNSTWRDWLQHREDRVTCDDQGRAYFPVNAGSISVWVLVED